MFVAGCYLLLAAQERRIVSQCQGLEGLSVVWSHMHEGIRAFLRYLIPPKRHATLLMEQRETDEVAGFLQDFLYMNKALSAGLS